MSEMKRGPGRPPKPPFERKRNNMTFRIRDLTRERMEAAALAGQCSCSEWTERLIEAHFAGHDLRTIIREEIRAALAELNAPIPGFPNTPLQFHPKPGQVYDRSALNGKQ